MPHPHPDTAACGPRSPRPRSASSTLLGDRARALVLGVARTVAAVTVWFNVRPGPDTVASDSLRASLRRAWRGGSFSPRLDSWYGWRYRAFYLVFPPPVGAPAALVRPRLILVDIAACTAFDRRVHRKRGSGRAEPC